VFVYRDVSDPAPTPSARHAAADDTAYWYDLLAEDPGPEREEVRGPFEPLLPSAGTPGTPGAADGSAGSEQAQGPPEEGPDERREAPEQARARKLEQLKDLYLTAEAIGEHNVDKHFDQLLAQQRELISEYFRQSPAAAQPGTPQPGTPQPGTPQSGVTSQEAGAEPGHRPPGASGGPGTPPEGASVRAEPPRAW
jgi:hypothetical protein